MRKHDFIFSRLVKIPKNKGNVGGMIGRGEKVTLENCVAQDTVVFASGGNAGGMIGNGSFVSFLSCFQKGGIRNMWSGVVISESGGAGGLIGFASEKLEVKKSGLEGGRVNSRGKQGSGGGIVGRFKSGRLSFSLTYVSEKVRIRSSNSGGIGGILEGEGSVRMENCFSLASVEGEGDKGRAFGVFGMKGTHTLSSCNLFLTFPFSAYYFDPLSCLEVCSEERLRKLKERRKKKERCLESVNGKPPRSHTNSFSFSVPLLLNIQFKSVWRERQSFLLCNK